MRIEAYNHVQQLYQPRQMNKVQQAGSVSHKDQLQLSSSGKDWQTARSALAGTADVREELTASIKDRVQNGTYSVDPAAFADRLMQRYEEMR